MEKEIETHTNYTIILYRYTYIYYVYDENLPTIYALHYDYYDDEMSVLYRASSAMRMEMN